MSRKLFYAEIVNACEGGRVLSKRVTHKSNAAVRGKRQ